MSNRPVIDLDSAYAQVNGALASAPFVPTVYPGDPLALVQFVQLLSAQHYPVIEMLARPLDAALKTMRQVSVHATRSTILWGIGTLKTRDQAEAAVEVGPDFLVSPAFSRDVLEVSVESGIPYIPAAQTFQDVQDILDAFAEYGLAPRVIKLCPVVNLSPQYAEMLTGCFPGVGLCPTGEINLDNFENWKRVPGVLAPMESTIVPPAWIRDQSVELIQLRLREMRQIADQCRPVTGSSKAVRP